MCRSFDIFQQIRKSFACDYHRKLFARTKLVLDVACIKIYLKNKEISATKHIYENFNLILNY